MKYIRTKDGRILEINKMVNPCVYETKPNKQGVYEEIGNGWVEQTADTIEELCDEFVYINKKKYIKCFCLFHQPITTIYYGAKLEDVETQKLINDTNIEIYGAIWIDKGLIYVAKVNDKGELELL